MIGEIGDHHGYGADGPLLPGMLLSRFGPIYR